MNYQEILNEIQKEIKYYSAKGEIASYIPELATVNPDKFGAHLCCHDGGDYAIGHSNEKFSIQSISKVFSLTMAFSMVGDSIWNRVGVEPSGDPFNSLVQLEFENGIPRNPLINPGALVIADILVSNLDNPKKDFLQFVRKIAGNDQIDFNPQVAKSEAAWGFRNASLTNLMCAFGNIKNDIDEVLDFYFHQCAIEMSCAELAKSFLLYSNHGELKTTDERILSISQTKRINAIMQTCGFYDEAGEFSFKVGLPGKSGVEGGIVALFPKTYAVAVWSPRLNEKGNSYLGMVVLELLTTKTGVSIF